MRHIQGILYLQQINANPLGLIVYKISHVYGETMMTLMFILRTIETLDRFDRCTGSWCQPLILLHDVIT